MGRDFAAKIVGRCKECGKFCTYKDFFIVNTAVWNEAGMAAWDSGHLHMRCLVKRLGRPLAPGELLAWFDKGKATKMKIKFTPDYLKSPEYLEHS